MPRLLTEYLEFLSLDHETVEFDHYEYFFASWEHGLMLLFRLIYLSAPKDCYRDSVNDTGGKIAPGKNDTGDKYAARVIE